jgi:hypothetical protein
VRRGRAAPATRARDSTLPARSGDRGEALRRDPHAIERYAGEHSCGSVLAARAQ